MTAGQNLTFEEAKYAMDKMLGGGATHAQIASFLTALMIKGETLDEIVGCATVMREKASQVSPKGRPNYTDLVGTGGDGTFTFNISTTAAFAAAGAGCNIAKHGNRSISSKSGAVDVLEKLGINVMLEAPQVEKCIEETGIGFMFAQLIHKSMKEVGVVRRELGIRTVFNILGPLSNPSGAENMVVGVFSKDLVDTFSKAMKMLGVKNALVMHSDDGMDELSTSSDTLVAEIKNGEISIYTITPEQFGLKRADISALKGGDAEFTILAFSADDYPSIPDVDRSDSFSISQAMLKNMINQTKFAVATSDNKPILTGELFEIQDGYFNLVAIDGFRLAVRTAAAGSDDRRKFVVKEKTLSEVSKLLKDEDKPVTMYLSKKHIIFDVNGCMVISRLLEGEFHNYRSSIPKSHSTEVILNTKDILTSLDRCSSLIDDQAKAPVRCIFENGNVNVSCSTSSGKFNGDFAAQITGAKVEIGFNCRYLMDAINATESDKVKILLNGGLSPMKIVPTDGDSYTFLVLPVRLKSE